MKVFYHPSQNVLVNDSLSPSAGKPSLVVESWGRLGIPLDVVPFRPLGAEEISLVHDPRYVENVLACRTPNGFGNRSSKVAAALPWVCGSAVAAALASLESGQVTFSPTSGAHHAHYDHGGGFCTFNFLVLAAVFAKKHGADRVGILDLDAHFGDGTDSIIKRLGLTYIRQYSFGSLSITPGKQAEDWIRNLRKIVRGFSNCDLLIYNAGVDPHIDDPLGGTLTTDQIRRREEIVFEISSQNRLPVCVSLAGGYQKDENGSIDPVLRLHDLTLLEAANATRSA